MVTLPKDVVKKILADIPNGQFFNVEFLKKDGTLRKMLCQKGVHKHVKGNGTSPSKHNPDLQVVWEKEATHYKSFDTTRVVAIKGKRAE